MATISEFPGMPFDDTVPAASSHKGPPPLSLGSAHHSGDPNPPGVRICETGFSYLSGQTHPDQKTLLSYADFSKYKHILKG